MPMMINIAAILCIEVPCAYWFSSLWGLKGIWYAYALAFVSLCILQAGYYQFFWKKKPLKRSFSGIKKPTFLVGFRTFLYYILLVNLVPNSLTR
jgi:hypothetical protein